MMSLRERLSYAVRRPVFRYMLGALFAAALLGLAWYWATEAGPLPLGYELIIPPPRI